MKLKENFELQGTDNVQGQIHMYPSLFLCHMEATVFNPLNIFAAHGTECLLSELSIYCRVQGCSLFKSITKSITNTQWCTQTR